MINEAIILVGGLGTRLRIKIGNYPKPMALIGDKPFLAYLLNLLSNNGLKRVVLAVGYKHQFIENYFGNSFANLEIVYSVEEESNLLGTGGAIVKASKLIKEQEFFVFNGDTFFDIEIRKIIEFHKLKKADITVALKFIENALRYGIIKINENGKIINFLEKGKQKEGFINGGIYLVSKSIFKNLNFPEKFSFEMDLLQKYYKAYNFYGIIFNRYFIDIGVPDDYEKAKIELPSRYRQNMDSFFR